MIRVNRARINGGVTALIAAAGVLVACGGGEAPSPAAAPPAQMPADHPPMAEVTMPASRLPPSTVLATVGGETVTAGDVDAALAGMPNADRLGYVTSEAVRELVEMLADRRLMARAARAEGLDADPVMREMLAAPVPGATPDQLLAEVWLENQIGRLPPPGAAEVERYYREHPEEFAEPARVRVTRVTAASEAEAGRLREELARGASAAELGARATELWLQDVPKAPDATRVALALAPGAVSPALPAAGGFVVMRVEERIPARDRGLEEVRAGILATLEDRRRQDALAAVRERLRRDVSVQVDQAAVSSFLGGPHGGS
jgi:hypothetical protein